MRTYFSRFFVMAAWTPSEAAEFAVAKRLGIARALGDGDVVLGIERLLVAERRAERRVPLPPPPPKTPVAASNPATGASPPTASQRRRQQRRSKAARAPPPPDVAAAPASKAAAEPVTHLVPAHGGSMPAVDGFGRLDGRR